MSRLEHGISPGPKQHETKFHGSLKRLWLKKIVCLGKLLSCMVNPKKSAAMSECLEQAPNDKMLFLLNL
jgi:hypothetical protein